MDTVKVRLIETGYLDKVSFGQTCRNDSYLNDRGLCQAVVKILDQVGITAELNAIRMRNAWPGLRQNNFQPVSS